MKSFPVTDDWIEFCWHSSLNIEQILSVLKKTAVWQSYSLIHSQIHDSMDTSFDQELLRMNEHGTIESYNEFWWILTATKASIIGNTKHIKKKRIFYIIQVIVSLFLYKLNRKNAWKANIKKNKQIFFHLRRHIFNSQL
jgi:hypothetical protein